MKGLDKATIAGLSYAGGSLLPADSNVHFWRYRKFESQERHEKKHAFGDEKPILRVERD